MQKEYAELQAGDTAKFQGLYFRDERRFTGIVVEVGKDSLFGMNRARYVIQPDDPVLPKGSTDQKEAYDGLVIRYHPLHAGKPECDEVIFQEAVDEYKAQKKIPLEVSPQEPLYNKFVLFPPKADLEGVL